MTKSPDGDNPTPLEGWQKRDGKSTIYAPIARNGGIIYVLGVEHHSPTAARTIEERYRPFMKADPASWLIGVEGYFAQKELNDEDIQYPEILASIKVGRELNVPIIDPFFAPDNEEVTAAYLATPAARGVDRKVLFSGLVDQTAHMTGREDTGFLALHLGLSRAEVDELKSLHTFLYYTQPRQYMDWQLYFSGQLLNTSNWIATQTLDYMMNKHLNRKNVFLQCGDLHKYIATLNPAEAPQGLSLSPDQIKNMLDSRERRKLAFMQGEHL